MDAARTPDGDRWMSTMSASLITWGGTCIFRAKILQHFNNSFSLQDKMPKRKVTRQVTSPPPGDEPYEEHDQEKGEASHVQMSSEQAEKMAQFFEDNPIFYDITNEEYKDRVKRATLLKQLSDEIGIDPDRIWTKFTNMRTDFFKLKKRIKGKSGDGLTRMTALQKYKLQRYAFLASHYKGGDDQIASSCLGSVGENDDLDETDKASVSSEQSPSTAPASCSVVSPADHPPLVKKAKRNEGKKDISEVLRQFLAESRREIQESRASIAEVIVKI